MNFYLLWEFVDHMNNAEVLKQGQKLIQIISCLLNTKSSLLKKIDTF